MDATAPVDFDPLSTYDYQHLNNYNYGVPNTHNYHTATGPPSGIKVEYNDNNHSNDKQTAQPQVTSAKVDYNKPNEAVVSGYSQNEDIKPVIDAKSKRVKGKKSNYWNAKIDDKNYKFYGCSICEISYKDLTDLDSHIAATHGTERISSYDLRKRNQKNKGKKKKKVKRNTKKGKKNEFDIDIEIKPEDGYIGTEKASEFDENDSMTNINEKVDSKTSKDNVDDKEKVTDDKFEKIYKCFACKKQFALSYYIRLHVRSHTGEKPYTCSTCGENFITASKLGRHNKRVHLTFKHQCRICFRLFSRLELLQIHFDKRHMEDKLEGEVYDYYAILPYLKEIEESLKMKTEESKPKKEDLWLEEPETEAKTSVIEETVDEKIKIEVQKNEDEENRVMVEEVKVMVAVDSVMEDSVLVKEEAVSDSEMNCDGEVNCDDGHFGDGGDKEDTDIDDDKDEDYFPSNTWASIPTEPPPPKLEEIKPPTKNQNGTLNCPVCNKIIKSVTYMKIHMRTHTGEKPFKCYLCGRGFITSSKMHRHVLTHSESWEEGEDKIKIENEDGKDGEARKKARAKFTKKPPKMAKRKGDLKRKHSCSFCHKRFLHIETLQVHAKSHEGETIQYRCHYCLEEMNSREELTEHEKVHTPPKPFLCTVCGKRYTKRETMVYHRKQHLPDENQLRYTCDICQRSFNAKSKLERHLASHSIPKYIYKYECPVCAHMFNTKYHIQMHLVTHQKEGLIVEENRNEILAMVLQNARKIPKQPEANLAPLQSTADDERSRICNICGEVFTHFYYLEEHLKSHGSTIALLHDDKEEVKKHICKICNKGFKLPYYLKLHNYIHTKEKPYICQQCGKGFITKGKLKRHIETHSGLKKFQCHICHKYFTRPSYLRIHVRTIHGTQDYNFRVEKNYDYRPIVSGEQ